MLAPPFAMFTQSTLCCHICAEPSSVAGVVGLGRIADQIDPHGCARSPYGRCCRVECSRRITLRQGQHSARELLIDTTTAHILLLPGQSWPVPSSCWSSTKSYCKLAITGRTTSQVDSPSVEAKTWKGRIYLPMKTVIAETAVAAPPTTNKHLIRWVEKMADLTQPDRDPLGRWLPG